MATNYSLQYGFTPSGTPIAIPGGTISNGAPVAAGITIADNSLQVNYANISLPGKNYLGYGAAVDQSLLNITEHFTSCSGKDFNDGKGPMNPVMGQIWFDAAVNITGATTTGALRYYTKTDGGTANAWNDILVTGAPIPSLTTNSISPIAGNLLNINGAGVFNGSWTLGAGATLNATYADLAERHHADAEYAVGTVMTVGGANEVTACKVSELALGVVSDQYAYLMNSEAGPDETHPAVGYIGRVNVRVVGPITKHQRIAPTGNGQAIAADKNSFGWALETNNEVGEKLVLCLIK